MTPINRSRRRAAAVICCLPALALAPARAEHLRGRFGFPVPHEENQIFFVQRSTNSNTIIYAARLGKDGGLDARRPVEVYWRRFNDAGERRELSFLERNAAFGVKARRRKGEVMAFDVHVVSHPRRSALLRMVDGRPRLEARLAGEISELVHAYLHVEESGSLPRITKVELFGRSLSTGAEVTESFTP